MFVNEMAKAPPPNPRQHICLCEESEREENLKRDELWDEKWERYVLIRVSNQKFQDCVQYRGSKDDHAEFTDEWK